MLYSNRNAVSVTQCLQDAANNAASKPAARPAPIAQPNTPNRLFVQWSNGSLRFEQLVTEMTALGITLENRNMPKWYYRTVCGRMRTYKRLLRSENTPELERETLRQELEQFANANGRIDVRPKKIRYGLVQFAAPRPLVTRWELDAQMYRLLARRAYGEHHAAFQANRREAKRVITRMYRR